MQHLNLTTEDEKTIKRYLEKNVRQTRWGLHLPERGISVGKCFIASSATETVLVRLGIDDRIIAILSNAEITPRYLGGGLTVSGQPFYVQEFVEVMLPDEQWYWANGKALAHLIKKLQGLTNLRQYLASEQDETYQALLGRYLDQIKSEYSKVHRDHRDRQPMGVLIREHQDRIGTITGCGLVPSHGDMGSGNILVVRDAVYLTDWETLHLSDPVRDVAHLLWWMYPQGEWKDVLGIFGMDLADTNLKERFYLYVSTRALYVYLLFVNTSQEHLAKRFLKDAQRSSYYQAPKTLLIT